MATLLEMYDLHVNAAGLRNRTAAAIAKAAIDVINEDPITTNHAARLTWAAKALNNPSETAKIMMWGLIGNATISASGEASSDNDIQFVVNGLIDTFSVLE